MVTIKCKNSFSDIYFGVLYSQLIFPTNLIWIFAYLFAFRSYFSLYQSHQYLLLAVSSLIWLLSLFIIVPILSALLVGLSAVAGRFKPHFAMHEYTLEGTTKASKNADSESKEDIKNINYVVETRFRFYLFKNGSKYEILNKKYIAPQDMVQVREFFKPKNSKILKFFFTCLPLFVLLIIGVTAACLLHTTYTMESSASPMTAYWKEDELVVAIPSEKMGTAQRLFDLYCPWFLHKPEPVYYTPYNTVQIFDINQGKVNKITLQGNANFNLFVSGDNLYYAQYEQHKKAYLKYNGSKFVPLTPQELTDMSAAMKDPHGTSNWKAFMLWDENDEETFDPEKDQDYWATFPLKTQTLKVHFISKMTEKTGYIQDQDYSLVGLGPAPLALSHFNSAPQEIAGPEFKELFPVKKLSEIEGAP